MTPVYNAEITVVGDPPSRPRNILYPQKLALTSLTCDDRSVGIVHSRSQAMHCSLVSRKHLRKGISSEFDNKLYAIKWKNSNKFSVLKYRPIIVSTARRPCSKSGSEITILQPFSDCPICPVIRRFQIQYIHFNEWVQHSFVRNNVSACFIKCATGSTHP
jgi:hypothetical protein